MHPFTAQLQQALQHDRPVPRRDAAVPSAQADTMAIQAELVGILGGTGAWKVSPWSEDKPMVAAPIPQAWIYQSGQGISLLPGLRLEVELALVSAADGTFSIAPAFELVRSRLEPGADWPDLAKKADLMSTAGLVLGPAQPLPAGDNPDCPVRLTTGDGATQTSTTPLLRDPLLRAAAWAADYADRLGLPFAAGTVIMTGARVGPMDILLGETVAELGSLGTVRFHTL
ncbi:hypothetical protein ASD04_05275 [Devosia sp. Root436]|uniref:hypothetical protein n=1 Tax=Devosia sp. Root436 TaxID=1736537 RepID=UPI0006FC2C3F|nr:hypothetical protein [Devosia sp. Root436]KQX40056.1 hypothetical protein ASD04_05275 [Devosia sp. Root436]